MYDRIDRHQHSDNVNSNYLDPVRTTADKIDNFQVDFGISSNRNVTCDFNTTVHSSTPRSALNVHCIVNNTNSTSIIALKQIPPIVKRWPLKHIPSKMGSIVY